MWRSTPAYGLLEREFLKEYLFFDLTLGRLLSADARREIFLELAGIFSLSREEAEPKLALPEHELVRAVTSKAQLERVERSLTLYAAPRRELAPSLLPILSYKQAAIERRDAAPALSAPTTDVAHALAALEQAAAEGHVASMGLLAFLALSDRLAEQDKEENTARLWQAAWWCSPFALLLAIRHFPERRPECAATLRAALLHRGENEVYEGLVREGVLPSMPPRPCASALEDAFERGVLSRETIRPEAYELLTSPILTEGTKCSLLLYPPDSYAAFPLRGVRKRTPPRKDVRLTRGPLARPEDKLLRAHFAKEEGMRRALWITAAEDVLLVSCRQRIEKALSPRTVLRISLRDYAPERLLAELVRAIENGGEAAPLLFLEDCESLMPGAEDLLYRLLRKKEAGRFALSDLCDADLSDVILVVLSKERPSARLAAEVDHLFWSGIRAEERETALAMTLTGLADVLAVPVLSLSPEEKEALLALSPHQTWSFLYRFLSSGTDASRSALSSEVAHFRSLFGIRA